MAVWDGLNVLDLATLGELREAFCTKGLLLYRKYKKNNIETQTNYFKIFVQQLLFLLVYM